MAYGLSTKNVDVGTAFLYGDLDEEIFTNCPKELDCATNQDEIKLLKYIYCLVKSTRQCYNKMVEVLLAQGCKVLSWIPQ